MLKKWWVVALVLVVGVLLAGCSDEPPKSTFNPLAYPGVAKVDERTLGEADAVLHIYKSVEFVTADAPEVVLKYYREKMEGDGWKTEEFQPDPKALMFRWESYEQPPTTYWCEVAARSGDAGVTKVRIDLRDSAGN